MCQHNTSKSIFCVYVQHLARGSAHRIKPKRSLGGGARLLQLRKITEDNKEFRVPAGPSVDVSDGETAK